MMAICTNCGSQVADGVKFCTSCGTAIATVTTSPPVQPAPQPIQQPAPPTYAVPAAPARGDAAPPQGSKYEPISTGGFFGIMLLMLIPIVNFLLLIIWACGGCRKVNKQNFAKAMLLWMLVGIGLSVLIGIVFSIFFANSGGIEGIKEYLFNILK